MGSQEDWHFLKLITGSIKNLEIKGLGIINSLTHIGQNLAILTLVQQGMQLVSFPESSWLVQDGHKSAQELPDLNGEYGIKMHLMVMILLINTG